MKQSVTPCASSCATTSSAAAKKFQDRPKNVIAWRQTFAEHHDAIPRVEGVQVDTE